jgi:hypothetical protein
LQVLLSPDQDAARTPIRAEFVTDDGFFFERH